MSIFFNLVSPIDGQLGTFNSLLGLNLYTKLRPKGTVHALSLFI